MRVALVSLDYPPDAVEGVARQRQALAGALAALGHEVHVITTGRTPSTTIAGGVTVHRVHTATVQAFHPDLPVLDRPLTDAQLLCEGVLAVHAQVGLDVVDVPLWLAQPFALVRARALPVVVWLQTTLLQLVELQQRQPRLHELVLARLDRAALDGAAACIADSSSIVDEIGRLYGVPDLARRTALVYPGIAAAAPSAVRPARARLDAVVVGRLEQRKATDWLFDLLPDLLAAVPGLHVRFIGRDNSGADGFRRATGRSYPEAWAAAQPALADRVRFDGYVDDAALASRLAEADLLLHPAHYESFGLVFLEAMRASLPVVACAAGGALEVFPRGEADGACLVRPGDRDRFGAAIAALASDPDRRARLGAAGRARFEAQFSDVRMAGDTAAVYRRVVDGWTGTGTHAPRVFQVMEALQDRDAVSTIARTNAPLLQAHGGERPVMAVFAAEAVRAETGRLKGLRPRRGDSAIVHYWGYSRIEAAIARWPGPVALHYHNITPPSFFTPGTAPWEMTSRGYAQLARLAGRVDLHIGDSRYNVEQLTYLSDRPVPGLCVYPVVERGALLAAPWDAAAPAATLGHLDGPLWLFVGRLAPNKRQDDVMRAFDRFVTATGSGRLALVGDTAAAPDFAAAVDRLRAALPHGDRVAIVPSVTDAALRAWYRAADVFVSASRHEGFGMPLAEAMAFDLPILALDRAAVGETVGAAAVIVTDWDADAVADRVRRLLGSARQRQALSAAATRRLEAFSSAAAREGLGAAVRFLRDGSWSPRMFTPRAPIAAPETDVTWAPSII